MKNLLYLFLIISTIAYSRTPSDSFKLEGSVEGLKDSGNIMLYYFILKSNVFQQIADTTKIINEKFMFEGNIDELTSAVLIFDNIEIPLYLEPTAMKLSIDKNNPYAYKLSGVSIEKENIELRNTLTTNMKIINQLNDSAIKIFKQIDLHANEPTLVDSLMQKAYQYKAEKIGITKIIDSLQLNFIKNHNTYQIAPHLLFILARDNDFVNIDTVAAIYNELPERSKTTWLGKLALEQIKQTGRVVKGKEISVGDIAPNFSMESMQEATIELSDFREKSYVLLDFWASWCGPCIKGIPDIKNIYDKYPKNLKIIGISLDSEKENWLKAIDEHQIGMWPQILSDTVVNNSYFRNETDLCGIYNIKGIPTYIFIDKQGKVIDVWHSIGKEELSEIDKTLK